MNAGQQSIVGQGFAMFFRDPLYIMHKIVIKPFIDYIDSFIYFIDRTIKFDSC